MRISTLLLALFAAPALLTAQCDGERYREFVFDSFAKSADILYGSNYDFNDNLQDLYLDVYTPNGDTETARPLVILAHGGSFMFGAKDGEDVVPLAEDLTKMGFVVASIQYRLGINLVTLNLEGTATEAVVRGFHDMKAAIRYFRKDVAENGNSFGIDPDQIYLGGVSAGGFITLHCGAMDQESELPDYLDYTDLGLTGGIEGDTGNEGYSSEIAGLFNIAGAIKDTAYMSAQDPPMLNFHGTEDTVVPFDADLLYLLSAFPVTEVDGSNAVAQKADELGLVNCFEIYEGQGHVPHTSNEAYYDTTRSIISNFLSHLVCENIELDCSYREILVGVDEQPRTSLKVWPNPATDQVRLELPGTLRGELLAIRDLHGRVVRSWRASNLVESLNVSELPAGVYHVVVADRPEVGTRLVIR
ncbi:MAG: carboxylesterase family protein [Flavobacteriales bacterium]